MTTANEVRYLSATETAKVLRKALKVLFPATKFSVRTDQYAGGASIDIRWIDGPTEKQVEAFSKNFEGATFDGMIDLKSSRYTEFEGQQTRFGSDYIFTRRDYTPDTFKAAVDVVASRYGVDAPDLLTYPKSGEPYCDPKHPTTHLRLSGHYGFYELVYQQLRVMAF